MMSANRLVFTARLRAADSSWDQYLLVSLAHTSANEIERLSEMIADLEAQLEAASYRRFCDQRNGYFDGLEADRL